MKLYYYIPFWVTYISSTIIDYFKGEASPGSKWQEHFSTGYNRENFFRYIDDMKKNDFQAYWIMIIAPHGLITSGILILIIFAW